MTQISSSHKTKNRIAKFTHKPCVALVGCGYWGPNLVRNFIESEDAQITHICDLDKTALQKIHKRYPSLKATQNYDDLLKDNSIDAIVITTPVSTHYPLAKLALEHGKHVLVEKPLAASVKEGEALVALAKKKGLTLMIDHTFVYSNPVKVLKENISSLGELRYFDSTRVNLGLFQQDINVIWDLAPHDLSILLYLVNEDPTHVMAIGAAHVNPKIENSAYMVVKFKNNFIAHFHFNWLSPVKVRQTLISGSKKMMVYNDLDPIERIKIYDYGVKHRTSDKTAIRVDYRTGDVFSPHIDNGEALSAVCQDFVYSMMGKKDATSDGVFGLRVLRILEASSESIRRDGRFVKVKTA